ncbi:uncharacterized protein LOC143850087 [Tasmannia lanceolata]|uniref:uncharacterized protein LOC143850085 n=1 Tax=Tasmannia lanceolata TaxID=3420 RepID=UPI004063877D
MASYNSNNNTTYRQRLTNEEWRLESEIIRIIDSGKTESLNPNSPQGVTIGGHHMYIAFYDERASDYRVWQWHGHIILSNDQNEYRREYIYGHYYERMEFKFGGNDENENDDEENQKRSPAINLGLGNLIGDAVSSSSGQILHRNRNLGSSSK